MKTWIATILFLLFLFSGKTIACDCFPIENFCKTITYENNGQIWSYLHLYHVKVAAQSPQGMDVVVSKTFHGDNHTGDTLFIMSGNGGDCKVITSQFPVGEEMLIAAGKFSPGWYISECGVSFLKVVNGNVTGPIAEGIVEWPLKDFASLQGCGDMMPNAVDEPAGQPVVEVIPTVTSDFTSLQIRAGIDNVARLQVFDVAGREFFSKAWQNRGGDFSEQINMTGWPAGMYFFRVSIPGRQEVFKVIRQ